MRQGFTLVILLVVFGVIVFGLLYFWQFSTKPKENIEGNSLAVPLPTQGVNPQVTANDLPQVSVIAEGLEVPWAVVFLPEGGLLVTEREGRVRRVTQDGKLAETPIATLSQVKQIGEGGLHGIALHPDFQNNHFVYLYYTYSGQGNNTLNRVSRFTYTNGTLVDESTMVDTIPGAANHDGGRIKFGPDNYLYITTGDAQQPSLAQNTDSLAGKILRVKDDGTPAPGNPFNNRVYSYGHRNPQGIAWDKDGNLHATEHGPSGTETGNDEFNKIDSGKNYGWPEIRGKEVKQGMVVPLIESGRGNTWAPAGLAFVGDKFYFAGLRGSALYEVTDGSNLNTYFKNDFGRLREVVAGPDGMLYVTTSNRDGRGIPKTGDDKILRINPSKL